MKKKWTSCVSRSMTAVSPCSPCGSRWPRICAFWSAAIKINSDLERIGDQAVSIALRSRSLITQPQLKPLIDIPRMAGIVQGWCATVWMPSCSRTPSWPVSVIDDDDEVDNLRDQVFRELLTYMMGDPTDHPARH